MIRRPPRSTLDRSSAASDVYKRQGQRSPLERNNSSRIVYNTDRNSPQNNDRSRAQSNRNANRKGRSGSGDRMNLLCDYCEKRGHEMQECYKYLGVCSYCKKTGHSNTECRARNSPPSSPVTNRKVVCPFCRGPHAGMRCSQRTPPRSSDPERTPPREYLQGCLLYTSPS